MANPALGLGLGALARQGALKYLPNLMRSAGIGTRALPKYVAPRVATGGGNALVPVGNTAIASGRFMPPALRAATNVATTGGRSAVNPITNFVTGASKGLGINGNIIPAIAGIGAGGMLAGSIPSGDEEFDVGPSVKDTPTTNSNRIPNGKFAGGNNAPVEINYGSVPETYDYAPSDNTIIPAKQPQAVKNTIVAKNVPMDRYEQALAKEKAEQAFWAKDNLIDQGAALQRTIANAAANRPTHADRLAILDPNYAQDDEFGFTY